MTQEEIERNFEFIVRQQAQFSADIQLLQERQAKSDEKLNALTDSLDKLKNITMSVVGAVDRLADAQARNERSLADLRAQTERKFAEVAEQQKRNDQKFAETDERLNALINVVERYITRDQNGKPPPNT